MPSDHRTFTRRERRLEYRVEIGCEVVEAVGVAPRGDGTAAVAAMVVCDDAIVDGEVRNLVGPHPEGARDAVREHDGIAIFRPEDLGVEPDAILGANGYDATARQCVGRGEFSGRRTGSS